MLKSMLFGGGGAKVEPWAVIFSDSTISTYSRSVAVAPDGSVYVCGNTWTKKDGTENLLLTKFSSSGTMQWQKTLGDSKGNFGRSVAVAPDGSVYVCGYTDEAGAGRRDLLLAKFSSSGTVQWQKTFGYTSYDYGYTVAVAPDGSVYVSGLYNSGNPSLIFAKFSSSGTMQWCTLYSGETFGNSVAVAPDGSVYVSGQARNSLLLAKFSSSGTVQWQKIIYQSNSLIYGFSVAVAPDGSVYVCGRITLHDSQLLLAKFSSSGTVLWQKTLGVGSTYGEGFSVAVAPDGSVYVCGYTDEASVRGNNNLLLAKFSESGAVQWQKTLSTRSADTEGYSVAVAPDGSIYVCGKTWVDSVSHYEFLLVKITDSLIEKNKVTFGSLTFQDASLPLNNESFPNDYNSLSSWTSGTVGTCSLPVRTTSFTTNFYHL